MAKIDGILPADVDEAQLVGSLEDRMTDYNGLVDALTTDIRSSNLEGKLYRNTAYSEPKKVTDEKADLPMNKMGGYSLKFNKCMFAGQTCLTPSQREFGKGREQAVTDGIMRGRGHLLDKNFMETLCGPVIFCPSQENGGKEIVDNSMVIINPNNEGLTPEKLRKARRLLRGGSGGAADPVVMAHTDALDNLDNFDEFKSFECTYGRGSSLWGDVNSFPMFKGLTWREIRHHTIPNMDGTDSISQQAVVPITPNFDASGNIDPDTEIHWIPMYDRNTVGYENWHELCISMHDNLPGKLKKLLTIQFEFGHGLTRLQSKNVVWIGSVVEKNDCADLKPSEFVKKFPKVTDGLMLA